MVREGQIVLFRFPQTDERPGKLRPALVLRQLPGPHDDWLICMLSTQLSSRIPDFDELLDEDAPDFVRCGVRKPSVVRIARLAVVERRVLLGTLGEIAEDRLSRIRKRLSDWITGG